MNQFEQLHYAKCRLTFSLPLLHMRNTWMQKILCCPYNPSFTDKREGSCCLYYACQLTVDWTCVFVFTSKLCTFQVFTAWDMKCVVSHLVSTKWCAWENRNSEEVVGSQNMTETECGARCKTVVKKHRTHISERKLIYIYIYTHTYIHIQCVTGGTDQTSGECSLGQTIPI